MSPLEEKIYYPLAKLRTQAFRPLNIVLTSLGVKADHISYLGVVFMVIFVAVLPSNLILAFWLLFARMMADIIDGPLARYQKTDSDRGKFVDIFMDNTSFGLFVIGLARAVFLQSFWAALFLFSVFLVVVLKIINYNLAHKSKDWYFYACAGSFPYNFQYATYLIFAVYAFGGRNYLNGAAEIFSVPLLIKAASEYKNIQATHKPLK